MCAAHDPVEHYYPHDYVHRASRARAHVFSGINFGDLVKNSPIHLLKSPQKFPAIRYMYGNTKLCLWAFCLGCGLVYNDKWEIHASTKVKGQLYCCFFHQMFCSAHLSTHTWQSSKFASEKTKALKTSLVPNPPPQLSSLAVLEWRTGYEATQNSKWRPHEKCTNWHGQNVTVRLVKGLWEPYQSSSKCFRE